MAGNAVLVNFSGGETSPKSRGRFDLPWYATSAKKMQNFVAEISGPARFRPGFVYCRQTRQGQVARLITLQISNNLGYELEFTPGHMRVYFNKDLLTTAAQTITGITNASPAVLTCAAITGMSNGTEVILDGIVGMPQLNGRQVTLAGGSGNTFQLKDSVTGANIDTTALPAYASGGTAAPVYEITSPYQAADLADIQLANSGTLGYITNPKYVPYKITVDAYKNFTLTTYSRTNDPFALATQAVSLTDLRPIWQEDQRIGLGATMTPGADTGAAVTFTASAAVFSSADVGKYIRGLVSRSDTRSATTATLSLSSGAVGSRTLTASAAVFSASDVGACVRDLSAGGGVGGYAVITAFTDNQHVTATVITAFGSTGPIAAGSWAIESAGYAQISSIGGGGTTAVCNVISSFGSTAAIPSGSWAIVTVSTLITLSGVAVVNSTVQYTISGVVGATQANGNSYLLIPYDPAGTSGPRFILRSGANADIDSSGWGTYSSGGTATPLANQPALTITGITLGAQTTLTFSAGSVINENTAYIFSGITGTVELNGGTYYLHNESGVIHLVTAAGAEVDSSAWTAYVSGGIATLGAECPISVAFYEGRLVFGGTNQRPACLFFSRAPDNSGNSRYDDFTGGSQADFACFFQLAPVSGSSDYISWIRGGPDYMFAGTFGGPFRVSGSGLDIPITPSSINVRQFDTAGAEETMAAGCAQIFFVQRGGVALRSIKVINPYLATFESADTCLNAEQIGYSPIQRVVLQQGRPSVVWVTRADGSLCGLTVHITVQNADVVTGWHRHKLGGVNAKVLDIAVLERTNSLDQLWAVTQRKVNGVTRCFVEYMADDVNFPDIEDFFTSKANEDADQDLWENAVYRAQEDCIHMDAAATYDGSARGVAAAATLTPGAVSGTSVTFTASQNVFKAGDVGAELWRKPDPVTGLGAGRARITAYTSATQVTCDIDTYGVAFDSVSAIAAGDWYFAVSTIYGLGHIEGATPAVVGDGAVVTDGGQSDDVGFPTLTVANASITLPERHAVAHVGFPYVGLLETHNLEMGGRSGPAESKPRGIPEMDIRFLNSLGVEFGTNLYKMAKIDHRLSDAVMDRPAPVFSGVRKLSYEDSSSGVDDAHREKNVVVCQRLPLPAIVQFINIDYDTTDEGSGGQG